MSTHSPPDPESPTARLLGVGIMPVLRARHPERVVAAVAALVDEGMRAIELTLTTPGALELVAPLRREHGARLMIGMGSVLTLDDGRRCLDHGLDVLVSPVRVEGLAALASESGTPVVPGALTPSELVAAHAAQAPLVKMFPASLVGPGYLAEIRAPLPSIRVMPSGGVSLGSIGDWRAAGAHAVSLGGALIRDALEDGDLFDLRRRARAAIAAWTEER